MKHIPIIVLGQISSGTVMDTLLLIRTVTRGIDDYPAQKKPLYRAARSTPNPVSARREYRTVLISGTKNHAETRL